MNRVHLSAKDLEEAADVPVFGTAHRCSEADSVGSDVLASGAVRFPEGAACARRWSEIPANSETSVHQCCHASEQATTRSGDGMNVSQD